MGNRLVPFAYDHDTHFRDTISNCRITPSRMAVVWSHIDLGRQRIRPSSHDLVGTPADPFHVKHSSS